MASTVPVVGETYTFYITGLYAAGTANYQANPTIAAGDFQISTNGGAYENPDNLPAVVPAGGYQVRCIVSIAETNAAGAGGHIAWRWIDQADDEWDSGGAEVIVHATNLDSLATATALATAQADLDNPAQYKADVTNLDAAVSSRAVAGDAMTLEDDAITAAKIATDAITSDEIAASTAQEIADEILKRGVSNVEDTADAHSLAAIILGVLESSISGGTWTIKKTGGTTFTTKTVTSDANADPITGVT